MKFVCVSFLLLIFSGCGSSPKLPLWYSTREVPGYEGDRYLIGVALGPWFRGRGVNQIEVRAKADLATQIESTVSVRTRSFISSNSGDEKEEIATRFQSISKQETQLLITDVRRVQTWIDEARDQVAVAVVLDKVAMARRFQGRIAQLKDRLEPFSDRDLNFRQHLLFYKLHRELTQKIQEEAFKAQMFCDRFFIVDDLDLPNAQEVVLSLEFGPETKSPEKQWLEGVLGKVFQPYGVVFQKGAQRKLICDIKVSPETRFRYPTAVSDLRLHEIDQGKKTFVWSLTFRVAHHKSFEAARSLVKGQTLQSLNNKLSQEIDDEVKKLVGFD